jgi:hypothetical protein
MDGVLEMSHTFAMRAGVLIGAAALVGSLVGTGMATAGAADHATPAGAGSSGHTVELAVSAVGTYNSWYTGTGGSFFDFGSLTLNSDNTWTSAVGDGGSWTQSGKSIALADYSGPDATAEFVLVGSVSSKGLSSLKKPGSFSAPGNPSSGQWYATKK